ncbi:Tat binding protein 1-interacting [Penicillium italicum]|uniref:Tat binding protein 1-interacting n=1 Tax=Penicillium italicum TaxID=40296 RepID=A0A0A2KER7_PENIT|nr:Tat binding protein 1-interacting [Penicillium italicum]
MAPRKPKSDAPAGGDDASIIREYLRQQKYAGSVELLLYSSWWLTSPGTVVHIRFAFSTEQSEGQTAEQALSQAAKLLRELHIKKEIEERVSGKQTVYHALQDPSDITTPEVAAALKLDIERLEGEVSTLKANEKKARAELAALHAKPRISDLRQDIRRLETEESTIQARLASCHEDDPVQISPEERKKLEKEWEYWQRHANVRRRICRDLWGQCSEVLPENTTAAELWVSFENYE